MRVGIISQFSSENIGNKLQNYALQQTILEYADSVVTIKNKPMAKNASEYLRWFTFAAESVFINELLGKYRKSEVLRFHRKYIRDTGKSYVLNKHYSSLRKRDHCHLYCAGSDQVWKPNSGRAGVLHYLGFAPYDATFSYAASFGVDRIPDEYVEDVRRGLQHIKFISVREDAGKRIVEELTGRTDVQVLVDPTMLLTTQEWDRVATIPKYRVPEKYILTYFLGSVSQERRNAIEEKAAQMDCQIVELMDKNSPYYVTGPGEFVYLIKRAALVCTDSFHGSVFSFLYGRPLAIFDREGSAEDMSSRIRTLSDKFHLESCLVTDNRIPDMWEADYSAGYGVLAEEREKSKAFLDMVFQEAERAGLRK